MKKRIESLDRLRGMMAISIMIYHLFGWYFFKLDSSTILGKLGIYGVSIFFILSGLSMAIVYESFIKNIKTSIMFFIRRIFRIWPLFWLAILLLIIPEIIINHKNYGLDVLFLNFTTLFSFIKPDAYINTGAWSIGNEIVYYVLTPIIILIYNKNKLYGNLFTIITIIIGIIFSFYILNPENTLSSQWSNYINPLNNLFFYSCGIAIHYNLKNIDFKNYFIYFIIFSSLLFILLPTSGDQIILVTNFNRVIMSTSSILFVIGFFKFNYNIPKILNTYLTQLGIATYGIYLLHPILNGYMKVVFSILGILNPYIKVFLVILFTIFISLISFKYYENYFMKLGKKLTIKN